MKTELQTIDVSKVYPNFYQPRQKFDKDKVTELAESILSNGLINPITIRKWTKGRYQIVAGERRWRAHKIANLNQVNAFVKEYDNDGQWMIESLIENVHREDLDPFEKAKYLKKIMKISKLKSYSELSEKTGITENSIKMTLRYLDVDEEVKKKVAIATITESQARALSRIEDKELQRKTAKISEGKTFTETDKTVTLIKTATPEVKEALLDDKINTEQAERISKLETEKERTKAIIEHSAIKNISESVEKNIEYQTKAKDNRDFDKRLVQAKSWIASVRGSVTDSKKQLDQTIKLLIIATKFLPVMDDDQKERLQYDLHRFLETIEKSKQLADKIQGYL